MNTTKALLLSNSTMKGQAYMGWCKDRLTTFLGSEVKQVLFFPFAGVSIDYESYTQKVQEVLLPLGFEVLNAAEFTPNTAPDVQAILVGGGNTFELFHQMHTLSWFSWIKTAIANGKPYAGWSAGANFACPTLKTTNDMPITIPVSAEGLGLVPFQINAHYTTATIPNHGGESRQDRIKEFLVKNPQQNVLGLPEGMGLYIEDDICVLFGDNEDTKPHWFTAKANIPEIIQLNKPIQL